MLPALINSRHHLIIPDVIANWDGISSWEVSRLDTMEALLTPDDVVFDIGTEHGWLAGLIARWCGGMVLFEPSPRVWPNIRLTWEANLLPPPLATFCGFVGTVTENLDSHLVTPNSPWPPSAYGDECHDPLPYDYIWRTPSLPQTTLDDFILNAPHPSPIPIIPTVLNIDVEGAELLVLTGAMNLLSLHRPTVFCSVHPDLMERDYHHNSDSVYSLMADLDYVATQLGIDHETHVCFQPLA